MSRFDRLFGILLALRQGRTVPAAELAGMFGVSARTVYRDVETLSLLGIPVYAERGREGGFRLLEGFFLPPIMFSREEAVSLVLSLTLLKTLPARPFAPALQTAEARLLAAIPDHLRAVLADAPHLIGFEQIPPDTFHHVPYSAQDAPEAAPDQEGEVATRFMSALLEGVSVRFTYRSPYNEEAREYEAVPLGIFWDRGHWYLVGVKAAAGAQGDQRLWRADRVLDLRAGSALSGSLPFDVRDLLGRNWLAGATAKWREESPVTIRMSRKQAENLQRDWYYRHSAFEEIGADAVLMTFGEDASEVALELVRWLGPGAELIAPALWRELLKAQLEAMLAAYQT